MERLIFDNLQELIKYIKEELMNFKYDTFSIDIWDKTITFKINGFMLTLEKQKVYSEDLREVVEEPYNVHLETEFTSEKICKTQIQELGNIAEILEQNQKLWTNIFEGVAQ